MTPTEPGWERARRTGQPLAWPGRVSWRAVPPLIPKSLVPAPGAEKLLEPGHVDADAASPAAPRARTAKSNNATFVGPEPSQAPAGRPRRLLVSWVSPCVAAVGLALVALHVLIAENQFRLDSFTTKSGDRASEL